MKAGWQGGGNPHDQTEVNVLRILPSGRILKSLNGPVGVLGSPLSKFFRSIFPQADDPPTKGKDEENPKCGKAGDDKVEGKMKDVLRSFGR